MVARRARPPQAPSAAAVARPAQAALPDASFRRLLVVCLAVGSNLPDADLLYTSLAGGPLAYVLQHRGYTHTVVGALLGAALLWLACRLWLRHRRLRATGRELAWLAAAAVAGVLLHLAMDYSNSYGIHPFWPFYNGWVYGDSVYIVEPLLWLACVPLVFVLHSRIARALVAAALALAGIAVCASGLVALPAAGVFVLLGAAMLAVGRWCTPGVALGCGVALWLGVTAGFGAAGRLASHQLAALAQAEFPGERILDEVLTPLPADPVCWDAWLVQTGAGGEVMRQARIALLPRLIDADACRGVNLGVVGEGAGAMVPAAGSRAIRWRQQFFVPTGQIAALARSQCRARAFMQFARVPVASAEGPQWWLGDLRFGGGPGRGFAQLRLTRPPQACNFAAVPWLPPRPELLDVGRRSRGPE